MDFSFGGAAAELVRQTGRKSREFSAILITQDKKQARQEASVLRPYHLDIFGKLIIFVQNQKRMTPLVAVSDYEIERGKPMPSLNHSAIQSNLIMELAPWRNQYRIASELNLDLSEWPSVPDLSILPMQPLDLDHDTIAVAEAPICVIEIISPTQSLNELTAKARSYFAHGVRSCWIVLPPLRNIYVFSSPDEYQMFRANETLHDPVLSISFPLQGVFE